MATEDVIKSGGELGGMRQAFAGCRKCYPTQILLKKQCKWHLLKIYKVTRLYAADEGVRFPMKRSNVIFDERYFRLNAA